MASILKILKFEHLTNHTLDRVIEPVDVMTSHQADSYETQSEWGGDMDSSHLFHLSHLSPILKPNQNVVDLACGTGDLLLKLAQYFPKTNFTGVDLSEGMLQKAKSRAEKLRLTNVKFLLQDITQIVEIPSASADILISTLALHHLPNSDLLVATAREINRIIKINGYVYINDFLRLKSLNSVKHLVESNRNQTDKTFLLDFENSMLAAFSQTDVQKFSNEIKQTTVKFKKSRFVNFMFVVESKRSKISLFPIKLIPFIPWKKISLASIVDFLRLKLILG